MCGSVNQLSHVSTMISLLWCVASTTVVQVVDAAISESCFNMLDSCVPEFASHGYDRPPSGSTISGMPRPHWSLDATQGLVVKAPLPPCRLQTPGRGGTVCRCRPECHAAHARRQVRDHRR